MAEAMLLRRRCPRAGTVPLKSTVAQAVVLLCVLVALCEMSSAAVPISAGVTAPVLVDHAGREAVGVAALPLRVPGVPGVPFAVCAVVAFPVTVPGLAVPMVAVREVAVVTVDAVVALSVVAFPVAVAVAVAAVPIPVVTAITMAPMTVPVANVPVAMPPVAVSVAMVNLAVPVVGVAFAVAMVVPVAVLERGVTRAPTLRGPAAPHSTRVATFFCQRNGSVRMDSYYRAALQD